MDECLRCLSLPLGGEFGGPCEAGIIRFGSIRVHEGGKVPEIESKQPSHLAAFGFK